MNPIAEFVKENRKAAGLTQEQFALRSGLGLRFVRELEQGKETVRMDKVNDFLIFADTCGISRQTASKLIQSLVRLTPRWLEMCDESLLPDELNER